MYNNLDDFFLKNLIKKKTLLLSIDLDNTLIIRDKGANYVNRKTKNLIAKLIKGKKIIFLPNTGREIIGFNSFQKDVFRNKNGILASGSIILANGEWILNKRGKLDNYVINQFFEATKKGIIDFFDISYFKNRKLIYNTKALKYSDLFYSQNPKEWFYGNFPPLLSVEESRDFKTDFIFRIEFPIFKKRFSHKKLYNLLLAKSENGIKELFDLINCDYNKTKQIYSLKKKAFFNEKYKNKIIFGRFEISPKIVNKGIGLKNWLLKSNLNCKDLFIIHIGDKDSGLINDTIIKASVPQARVIMVGNKCKTGNPLVDLYMRNDPESEVLSIIEKINSLS